MAIATIEAAIATIEMTIAIIEMVIATIEMAITNVEMAIAERVTVFCVNDVASVARGWATDASLDDSMPTALPLHLVQVRGQVFTPASVARIFSQWAWAFSPVWCFSHACSMLF